MPKCIYCLEKEEESLFHREHVIPESFGRFKSNLTLTKEVCKTCNSYFGDELELFLGRDTFEGIQRFQEGVKNPRDLKVFREKRVKIRLEEKGPWRGAIMVLIPSHDKLRIEPIPQVGFKLRRNQWVFYTIENIQSKAQIAEQGFDLGGKNNLKLLYQEKNDFRKMWDHLNSLGFKLESNKFDDLPFNYNNRSVEVSIETTIDRIISRGVAKISFNYLTKMHGSQFTLKEEFNRIREFIRYGVSNSPPYVKFSRPILENDRRFGVKSTKGHILTVNWNHNRTAIIGQVSLFNIFTYVVILCRHFRGVYRPLAVGHHFDIKDKNITKLHSVSRDIINAVKRMSKLV